LVETKWHDGEDFTSEDVKYTYELFLTEDGFASDYGDYLTGIIDIKCPDDRTIVITTEESKANMLQNTIPILPEHIWRNIAKEDFLNYSNNLPVGTGPYLFGEMGDGFITLFVNEEYFTTSGRVPSYSFVEYDNNDDVAQALKLGEIDAALSLNGEQLLKLKDEEGIDLISAQIPGIINLSFNLSRESKATGNSLLKDVRIRHAIEYCIDKNFGINRAYSNSGTLGTTLINSNNPYHWEPTICLLRGYDIRKAKRLLGRAGYLDTNEDGFREDRSGNPLSFKLIISAENAEYIKYGQIIKAGCKQAGIDIDCEILDDSTIRDKIDAYDYDLVISEQEADMDPSDILEVLTTDFGNETGWSNRRYDKYFLDQVVTLDRAERADMVRKMQQIAYEEAPCIVLLYPNRVQAIRSDKWEGYIGVPVNGCYFLNKSIMNYMKMHSK
jgi:peptide/nickel transport system substrate-binding protein